MAETEMVSARLPAELVAALRKRAEGRGESLTDAVREGALMVLGLCPTCGQRTSRNPYTAQDLGVDDR